ncbi:MULTISPECIES: hypothetical protein [Bacillus]|jgi:hypothetical protein|uniref:Uncharacterized protein n=2 Tax=Bacillus TaxID=1386 RepID=G9QI27_9BACI|nr:hypothetical protein [Bacillus smithii]AKP47150.1 hypothetical protein BSM4216_1888 [Bacillus smithii]EHL79188.1 hypothetical protein HMPREF1015_01391 [Bacillus smithii 7_3_47FAA]MED0661295.1 hypothetical protein [Bacillus smithii]MED1490505.1 hypothetical protein [Bacillus smithii]MED4884374.1 hypothetical protein [Bacillus smithii]
MTRFINPAVKRKVSAKDSYKLGEPVVGVKAVAPVKGKEQVGAVVYKRKAKYGDLFENWA